VTPRRARPRLHATIAVLIAVALGNLSSLAGTAGAQRDPDPSTDARDLVRLVDQTIWVDPDGEIVVQVELGEGAPDDATVEVTLHERIQHRTDFERTLERELLRGRLTDAPLRLDPGELGSILTARIPIRSGPPVPDEPPRLGIADPGVHPVDVAVYGGDQTYLGGLVTHVVRLPPQIDDPRLGLVLVQPLPADPSLRPDGSVEVDLETKTSWTLAVSSLIGDPMLPIVVAPRPETLAALAAGPMLDRGLAGEVAELAAVGEVPLLPFVELDIDGMVRAGLGTELDRQLERGGSALSRHLVVEPTGQLWLAGDDLTTTALGALADRGVRRVILPAEVLAPADDDLDDAGDTTPATAMVANPFLVDAGDSTRVAALATDPLLQRHQGSTGDPRLDAHHLVADLALAWFDEPGTRRVVPLVLATDDVDPIFAETLRDLVSSSPLLVAQTASEAMTTAALVTEDDDGSTALVRSLARNAGTSNLLQVRSDIDLARLSIASFATVFPESDDLLDRFEASLAVVMSSGLDQPQRSAHLGGIALEMDTLLGGIDLPERRAITLPARDGTIPITLTNTSERDAVVALRLASEKLEFPEGERVEIPLPPGTSPVEVDVRARASGAFPLDIVLESPDGRIELGTARYTVRSTAVSGLGVAISAAAIIVLGVWWFRTARRARAVHRQQG
jgi:hypothetical protein